MAGIMSTNMIDNEVEIGRRLGILNHFRGEDAVGMFDYVPSLKDAEQIRYWKYDAHPLDFIKKPFDRIKATRWKTNPKLFAIHCRAATQGKLSEKNAHPFAFKNIVGMHNGTITKEFANRKKFETDSEALFYNIDKMGLRDALKELQGKDAAFALVWLNWYDGTLNFIRNYKRPLHVTSFMGGSTIAWSSEETHLKLAIESVMKNSYPQIKQFRVGVHYKIDIDATTLQFQEEEIEEAKEVVVYTPPSTFQGTAHGYSQSSSSLPASNTTSPWNNDAYTSRKDLTESSTYWLKFGKDAAKADLNWELYTAYDEESGLFFTAYAHERLKKFRLIEESKRYLEEQKRTEAASNNVVTFQPKGTKEEITQNSGEVPFNDELPWVDDYAKSMLNEAKDEIFYPFGVGGVKLCSGPAYRQKLAHDCCSCGNAEPDEDDYLFWLNDDEFLCLSCAQDVAENDNNWMLKGSISDNERQRIKMEIDALGFEDNPSEEKVAVH
jgi:hypothetical protein